MMKKITGIILSLLLVLGIFGCGVNNSSFIEPVTFYYPELPQEDGSVVSVISSEIRECHGSSDDLNTLLALYLMGPKDPAFYSPVPDQVNIMEASVADGKVTLVFNEAFAELSGLERSIACGCISLTVMDFTGAEQVEIFAQNALLDGEESILITRESLLIEDNTPIGETN